MLYIPVYMGICIYIYKHSNEYKLVFVKQQIKIAFFLYLPCFFFHFQLQESSITCGILVTFVFYAYL